MTYWAMALFFFLCVAAVYPVVVADNEAKDELLARIAPFQGVIGVLAAVSGLVLLFVANNLGVLSYVVAVIQIIMGSVLAYIWLSSVLSDGDELVANPIEEMNRAAINNKFFICLVYW
jgi:uncharacterized protein YacL